jgi:hypothetical protein
VEALEAPLLNVEEMEDQVEVVAIMQVLKEMGMFPL